MDPYSGYLAWGIYMYDKSEEEGHWLVNIYVNNKRVDVQNQYYAPHGSLPPTIAKADSVFHVEATLQTNEGFLQKRPQPLHHSEP